jgi:hypothetical protein
MFVKLVIFYSYEIWIYFYKSGSSNLYLFAGKDEAFIIE